jgi:CIC family chloride channel protein
LGVGYETVGALIQGDAPRNLIFGILLVKSIIWAVALGSGTSGGVLAPLLMMGGALGGLEAAFLPHEGAGFWPLVSMGAILGGTMRSPFTGIVFAVELTHDVNMFLPLLVAAVVAHLFTVLTLKRSILTEKVARRGFHLSREYAVDPLEILFVREVMRAAVVVLPAEGSMDEMRKTLGSDGRPRGQRLYPLIDPDNRVRGVMTRKRMAELLADSNHDGAKLVDFAHLDPVVAYPDEPLRVVVYRMAETGLTRLPVVKRGSRELAGMISLEDLLGARTRNLSEEQTRERVLRIRMPFQSFKSV